MATILRSAQSLEYVEATVAAINRVTGAVVDPTSDPVAFAFVPENDSVDNATSFISGGWVADVSDPAAPVYIARVMAGPAAGYVPVAGMRVDVYVSVTDNPEAPKIKAGSYHWT